MPSLQYHFMQCHIALINQYSQTTLKSARDETIQTDSILSIKLVKMIT